MTSTIKSVGAYLKEHYWRATRTAIQTFAAVIVQQWLSSGGTHGITSLWDSLQANWDVAAGTALLAAIAALGWKPGLLGKKVDG